MTKIAYEEYLASDHWQALRERCFFLQGKECAVCGLEKRLECHHITYRTPLTDCTPCDIMVLCKECHETYHRAVKRFKRSANSRQETENLIRQLWSVEGRIHKPAAKTHVFHPRPRSMSELRRFANSIKKVGLNQNALLVKAEQLRQFAETLNQNKLQ